MWFTMNGRCLYVFSFPFCDAAEHILENIFVGQGWNFLVQCNSSIQAECQFWMCSNTYQYILSRCIIFHLFLTKFERKSFDFRPFDAFLSSYKFDEVLYLYLIFKRNSKILATSIVALQHIDITTKLRNICRLTISTIYHLSKLDNKRRCMYVAYFLIKPCTCA